MSIIHPTLNLVARPCVSPPQATFTRATSATYVNALGQIATAASGVLRHDFDPLTGEYRGWLIEPQRTNLMDRSEAVGDSVYWAAGANSSQSSDTMAAPDGATTADTITYDGVSNDHRVIRNTTVVSATVYTASIFLKAGTIGTVVVGEGAGTEARAVFGLSGDGTAAAENGATSASITAYGNGWYRCTVTITSSGTMWQLRINPHSWGGTGAAGTFHVWGAQVEAGADATSYIPAADAPATRNADLLTVATSGFSFNAAEGTIYASGDLPNLTTNQYVFSLDDGTVDNSIFAYVNGSNLDGVVQVGGPAQLNAPIGAPGTSQFKAALAYKAGDFAVCMNGGTVTTDASGSVPSGLTTLRIGAGVSGGGQVNGHIRHVAYFPRALSHADLQTITGY